MKKRNPILTETQWREYAAKAKQVNTLIKELQRMPIAACVLQPHMKRIQRHMFIFCCKARCELRLQHPEIRDADNPYEDFGIRWEELE